jgi:hypothetical protein
MNPKLAEWLGNKLEAACKRVRMHCTWDEERRRKQWPLKTLHGLPRGQLVKTDNGVFVLLDHVMTLKME